MKPDFIGFFVAELFSSAGEFVVSLAERDMATLNAARSAVVAAGGNPHPGLDPVSGMPLDFHPGKVLLDPLETAIAVCDRLGLEAENQPAVRSLLNKVSEDLASIRGLVANHLWVAMPDERVTGPTQRDRRVEWRIQSDNIFVEKRFREACQSAGMAIHKLRTAVVDVSEKKNSWEAALHDPQGDKENLVVAVFLGNGRFQVGSEPIFSIDGVGGDVLGELVKIRSGQAKDFRSSDRPGYHLKRVLERFPQLSPFVVLPGGKGAGGYRTTIMNSSDL